jgi:hypothetical protein
MPMKATTKQQLLKTERTLCVATVTYRICGYIHKCSVNPITNPICSHTFIWHVIHIHTDVPNIQRFVNYCTETQRSHGDAILFCPPPAPPHFTCTVTLLQPSHIFCEAQLHQNILY